jgi:hypothetical protein
MRPHAIILGLLLLGGAAPGRAQEPGRHPTLTDPHPPWAAAYHAGIYWHRPATVAESHARGIAAMTRARAQYNLLTAVARLQAAKAQRLEMENRLRAIRAYFEAQQINQQHRAARRQPRRPGKP